MTKIEVVTRILELYILHWNYLYKKKCHKIHNVRIRIRY